MVPTDPNYQRFYPVVGIAFVTLQRFNLAKVTYVNAKR
jgi:hypothetical protein